MADGGKGGGTGGAAGDFKSLPIGSAFSDCTGLLDGSNGADEMAESTALRAVSTVGVGNVGVPTGAGSG